MPTLPITSFGRNQASGQYEKFTGKELVEPLALVSKTIKTEVGKIFKLLEEHLKITKSDIELIASNAALSAAMKQLSDEFHKQFNEQQSFVSNLGSATAALSAMNFKNLEGIFKHKKETTRVEVTNWADSKIGEQKKDTLLPVIGPMIKVLELLGLKNAKEKDLLKVEVKDFPRLLSVLSLMSEGKDTIKLLAIMKDISGVLVGKPEENITFHRTAQGPKAGETGADPNKRYMEQFQSWINKVLYDIKPPEPIVKKAAIGGELGSSTQGALSALPQILDAIVKSGTDIVGAINGIPHVIVDNYDKFKVEVLGSTVNRPEEPKAITGEDILKILEHMKQPATAGITYQQPVIDATIIGKEAGKLIADATMKINLPENLPVYSHVGMPSSTTEEPATKTEEKRAESAKYAPAPKRTGSGGQGKGTERGGFIDVAAITAAFTTLLPGLATFGSSITAAVPGLVSMIPASLTLASVFVGLGAVTLPIVVIMGALLAIVVSLVAVFAIFSKVLNLAIDTVTAMATSIMKASQDVVQGFMEGFGKWASGDFFGGLSSAGLGVVKGFEGVGSSALSLIPLIGGQLSDIFKQLTGIISTAISAMSGFASNMLPFVQQLSPSTVENFNYQMRGLQATIGVTFAGFISAMADTIQKISGILLPVTEELAPLFSELGDIIRGALLPIFKVIAALIGTLIAPLSTALGGLRSAVTLVIRNFVLLAAMIARLFGADDFVARLRTALARPEGAGATPAGPAAINSFEQIAKDIALASATASVGAGPSGPSPTDLMSGILETVTSISEEDIPALMDRFATAWENFEALLWERWDAISDDFEDFMQGPFVRQLSDIITRIINDLYHRFERAHPQAAATVSAIQEVGSAYWAHPVDAYIADVQSMFGY